MALSVGLAALVLAGCGPAPGDGEGPAGDGAPVDTAAPVGDAPNPGPGAELAARAVADPAGDSLLVEATGFPPSTGVEIGLGPPRSEYEVVDTGSTTGEGFVSRRVALPDWLDRERPYVAVVATRDHAARAVSEPIGPEGGAADGAVTVTGEITGEGPECPELRADGGEIYSLTGAPEGLSVGDRVTVTGRPVEMSFCMRGTPLEVRSLTRVDGG